MSCQKMSLKSLHIHWSVTNRCRCMSRYVELNSPRGKRFSEIFYALRLNSPVDNTVHIRINASPAVDIITSEVFLRRTSISSK